MKQNVVRIVILFTDKSQSAQIDYKWEGKPSTKYNVVIVN